jgi:hypothetical protein
VPTRPHPGTVARTAHPATVARTAALAAGMGVLAFAVVTQRLPVRVVASALIALALAALLAPFALRWRTLLGALVLCILFIPMRRYSLPGKLPFQLEPYRLTVAVVAFAWLGALLVDRRVRVRRSGFERPIAAILLAYIFSDIVNWHSIGAQGINSYVIKGLTFFLSFLIVFYLVVSLVRTRLDLDFVIKLLVGGAAVVALAAVIEARTRYNVFNHLHSVLPVLHFAGLSYSDLHDGRLRAMGSAEHPIALGAGLVLVLPLALYLIRRTGQVRWTLAAILIGVGTLASRSRTPILMLVVMGLILLWLRPRAVKRYWPALIPVLFVAQIAMPGLASTIVKSFFPKGGLVAQQAQGGATYGAGRVADLGLGLKDFAKRPILGSGFASRITDRAEPGYNAHRSDDQWLGTLLETGLAGTLAWVWLFVLVIRRLGRSAKKQPGPRGLLYVALAGSVAAFAESMATYDAFSFIQEVFILFLILAVAAIALLDADEAAPPLRAA